MEILWVTEPDENPVNQHGRIVTNTPDGLYFEPITGGLCLSWWNSGDDFCYHLTREQVVSLKSALEGYLRTSEVS